MLQHASTVIYIVHQCLLEPVFHGNIFFVQRDLSVIITLWNKILKPKINIMDVQGNRGSFE